MKIPQPDGTFTEHTPGTPRAWARPATPPSARIAYAAAHVVADRFGENTPGAPAAVDWESTLAFRRHLCSYGLGVAEAMDTAQRGMGLDWAATRELIRRSAAEARACGGRIAAGAGTDHAPEASTVDEVVHAYLEQVAVVEDAGARVILMASRQLAAVAAGPGDYHAVYGRVLGQVSAPVILHWLGPMFDPALEGYWGSAGLDAATESFVALVTEHAAKVDGVKVSLLDAAHEVRLRRALPAGVRLYTGDDFNYPALIRGDEEGHSDALLGVFAAIAPAASAALQALDAGDLAGYREVLEPTVPLARHLFAAPTYYYKTGIAFLAWLSGHQPGFTMVGGLASGRSVVHLAQAYRMADALGLLPDPELAADRMRAFLTVAGVA
ncbi:dihydrodipicolinate synthase family protein [Amycolatopsis cynarae]|uniref:Dihydrodipicolinate synthase family protein n=1 Tax=Amycolatopsis cynarae TaxID=2995223 RepID=A0ABY7AVA2_9PSEU|nr:dihydrodipicolinate synthase family protein [Amycolatopsis sp. HUAS 11-8]WAL63629.1 dihydrodipicolinate synthase family protein [Amycolatopsis sp. HUAS 11-8]